MKKIRVVRLLAIGLLGSLPLLTACDAPESTGVGEPARASLMGASLLECPSPSAIAVERRVLPIGGVVEAGGNSVLVPASAILGATEIGIEVPATQQVRVELTANDAEHWQFLAPVTVTIDYSRCPDALLQGKTLSVWYIDSETGEMLENMGGIDNRAAKQITFTTDHFSGYAIAN